MYASLEIDGFRCFRGLTVGPLARVNLIAGPNNVGKTALLEALWMLCRPSAPLEALRNTRRRGVGGHEQGDLFADLFLNYNTGLAINLKAECQPGRGSVSLDITSQTRYERPIHDWSSVSDPEFEDGYIESFDFNSQLQFQHTNESGLMCRTTAWLETETKLGTLQPVLRQSREPAATGNRPCLFESPGRRHSARSLAALFGEAQVGHYVLSIEKAIRILEPRLQRLEVITDRRGIPEIHGDLGTGKSFPMSVMGEGTKRLLALALSFKRAQNGVMLVDEVENGLHYSVLPEVWKTIDWFSREFNVQVFATTHSYECIVAAHSAFKQAELDDDFSLLRLQRNRRTGQIESIAYDDKEGLEYAMEYEREVR